MLNHLLLIYGDNVQVSHDQGLRPRKNTTVMHKKGHRHIPLKEERMSLTTLMNPLEINHMQLKNRIMFPPMTTGYEARDGSITQQSINFYRRVAQGGASYIVLGDVAPVYTISPTPKLVTDEQIPSFAALADALHEFDCKLGIQVFHPEYDTVAVAELFRQGDMAGARAKLHHDMSHYINEVSAQRLGEILDSIKALAARATKAGVDAIEVHGDRLIGSLCSTLINQRTDEYGGSFENRTRFARAVVHAIREGSPDICIDYKLPIVTENPQIGRGGLFIDEAVKLAKLLEEDGVDTFHVAQANHTGNLNDTIPAMGTRPACFMEPYARRIKEAVSVPVSTVGRILTPEQGAELIESGACDYIGLGRPMLCDPDYANKVAENQTELIRPCMMCNRGCTDAIASRRFISCVLNAEGGYEYQRTIQPVKQQRNIIVVGGGPAGMEAARVAALRGNHVTLFEQSDHLGGQLGIACTPPRKKEMSRVVAWYSRSLEAAGVEVKLNTAADAEMLVGQSPDEVIVAVGGRNAEPHIEGADLPHVISAWDLLAGNAAPTGRTIVIGGGLVGAETAEFIAQNHPDCEVSIVEMTGQIAAEESSTIKPVMMQDFADHKVALYTDTKVERIKPGQIIASRKNTDDDSSESTQITLPCDSVVMAIGTMPAEFDVSALESANITVRRIGDCNGKTADINRAVEEGYLAATA